MGNAVRNSYLEAPLEEQSGNICWQNRMNDDSIYNGMTIQGVDVQW